ncbi:MAG TPA: YggT family protein [Clostridia bacterium]|nr:YggT family protein [Clostridia bacterium]
MSYTLIQLVRVAFELLSWLIIARALLTWIPNVPYNSVVKFIHEVTDPVMIPIQRMLPYSLIPFSPIVAILVIQLVEWLVLSLLYSL